MNLYSNLIIFLKVFDFYWNWVRSFLISGLTLSFGFGPVKLFKFRKLCHFVHYFQVLNLSWVFKIKYFRCGGFQLNGNILIELEWQSSSFQWKVKTLNQFIRKFWSFYVNEFENDGDGRIIENFKIIRLWGALGKGEHADRGRPSGGQRRMAVDGGAAPRRNRSVLWRSAHHRPTCPHRLTLHRFVWFVSIRIAKSHRGDLSRNHSSPLKISWKFHYRNHAWPVVNWIIFLFNLKI